MSLEVILSQPPSQRRDAVFVKTVEPTIYQLASSLLRRAPSEDQMQDARLAALQALHAYDPARSPYFLLTLALHIRRTLYRSRRTLIHIPEHQRLNLARLARLEEQFLCERQRLPTEEEIGYWLSLTPAQVSALQAAQITLDDDNETFQVAAPDPYANTVRQIDIRNALCGLKSKNPQAATIIELRYLQEPPLSIQCIAERLHISYKRVQRLLTQGIAFLRPTLAEYATA